MVLLRLALIILVLAPYLGLSAVAPADQTELVRASTRSVEFDFVSWTANAILVKISQGVMGAGEYLPPRAQHDLVLEYAGLIRSQARLQAEIASAYADPGVSNPAKETTAARRTLADTTTRLNAIGPFAETILQKQIEEVVAILGLSTGGQSIPPIWFHSTALPMALIVSPRNVIRSDVDVSLQPDLTLEQMITIEDNVSQKLNLSALVVPVGGIGIYPTMVDRSDDLNWLTEVISHEWTHNYLTLRPLGLNYETTPELRTMNETTANISGVEIGAEVIRRFYPELAPPPPVRGQAAPRALDGEPAFNFRATMHETRVKVDQLLSTGNIQEAEAYMESQRRVFYNHGYQIRKLNQAYFAFYGAYADQPGGAAGEDPVGPAVRKLREQSASLADFLNKISRMTSFDQLKQAVRR